MIYLEGGGPSIFGQTRNRKQNQPNKILVFGIDANKSCSMFHFSSTWVNKTGILLDTVENRYAYSIHFTLVYSDNF